MKPWTLARIRDKAEHYANCPPCQREGFTPLFCYRTLKALIDRTSE